MTKQILGVNSLGHPPFEPASRIHPKESGGFEVANALVLGSTMG
jgi:hypothetical protein